MLVILVGGGLAMAVIKINYGLGANTCVPNVMIFICTVEFVVIKGIYYCRNEEMRKKVLALFLNC